MESKSSFVSSVSSRENCLMICCRLTFQRNWFKNKGAILVLIWTFLSLSIFHFFGIHHRNCETIIDKISTAELLATGLLFPIGGWLADAYFGRYRVIRFGMWTMWFGAMMNGFSLVIGKAFIIYGSHGDLYVSFACRVIMGAGLGVFLANIIQFGIDQLIDASSTEIKSFIVWCAVSILSSGVTLAFGTWCAPEYVPVLAVAVCLTLAVISNFLLNNWLNKEQVVNNPLPLISKVVYFTMRRKFAKQKTLHVEQKGWLSKLNIAKRVYNGPFSSEQVEDVKTFFRIILVITTFVIACSGVPTVQDIYLKLAPHFKRWPLYEDSVSCYMRTSVYYSGLTLAVVVALLYQILIKQLFHKFIPKVSITTKFYFSVLLFFASVMSLLGMESASYIQQTGSNYNQSRCVFHSNGTTEIDYYWLVIPFALNGMSGLIFLISAIEFICAQAPFNMKGLILGLGCSFYGLSNLIQTGISFLFTQSNIWERAPLTCEIWYFMLQGFIVLISFLIVMVIVKTYKRRTRVNLSSHSDLQDIQSDLSIQ